MANLYLERICCLYYLHLQQYQLLLFATSVVPVSITCTFSSTSLYYLHLQQYQSTLFAPSAVLAYITCTFSSTSLYYLQLQ